MYQRGVVNDLRQNKKYLGDKFKYVRLNLK